MHSKTQIKKNSSFKTILTKYHRTNVLLIPGRKRPILSSMFAWWILIVFFSFFFTFISSFFSLSHSHANQLFKKGFERWAVIKGDSLIPSPLLKSPKMPFILEFSCRRTFEKKKVDDNQQFRRFWIQLMKSGLIYLVNRLQAGFCARIATKEKNALCSGRKR